MVTGDDDAASPERRLRPPVSLNRRRSKRHAVLPDPVVHGEPVGRPEPAIVSYAGDIAEFLCIFNFLETFFSNFWLLVIFGTL